MRPHLALIVLALLGAAAAPAAVAHHLPTRAVHALGDVCLWIDPLHVETTLDGGCTLTVPDPASVWIHVHGVLGEFDATVPFKYRFVHDDGTACTDTFYALTTVTTSAPPGCRHVWVFPRLDLHFTTSDVVGNPWGEIFVQ